MATAKAASAIRLRAKLLRPASTDQADDWTFLVLPRAASAQLPSRGLTTVAATLNGVPFRAVFDPDGQKSHWLKIDRKLLKSAQAEAGDEVTLEIGPAQLEPEVPADLKKALAAAPKARAVWEDITVVARQDWIHWVITARQEATRAKRIHGACDMLAKGKRRVCCFDRTGFYSKAFSAPVAAKA
jgi:hypothetical protein